MITDVLNTEKTTRPLVLITGASRGIGRACAIKFAEEGCDLILTCRQNEEALEETAAICERHTDKVIRFAGDIGDPDVVEELWTMLEEQNLVPEVLIHNAGITKKGLLQDFSLFEWTDIFDTNVTALFMLCKKLIPHMVRRHSGKILVTSSVYGSVGASCEVPYSASKGAINGFVRGLSKELAPSNIQVNAVAPGAVDTDMILESDLTAESLLGLQDEIPAGRLGRPAEIAEVFWHLANAPEYLTGQVIGVDGGWM